MSQAPRVRAVGVRHPDLHGPGLAAREGDLLAVRAPRRSEDLPELAAGHVRALPLVDRGDEDLGRASSIRHVGEGAAVGAPGGKDVEALVDRHTPRVESVVVDDVELLRAPLLGRVAVGGEGDLGARHAAVLGQREDVVGGLVGEDPGVVRPAGVALRQGILAGVHEVDLHLDESLIAVHLGPTDYEQLRADGLPVLEGGSVGVHGRDGREQALRDELEQALELQVVAEDLGDGAAGLAARVVGLQRNAVGDREALCLGADDDLGLAADGGLLRERAARRPEAEHTDGERGRNATTSA